MAVLEREQVKTYRSAAYPSRTFSMDQTPEAFMALSGLYSDRVLAVVREIGTNARDAHIEAGKPEAPFHVHLPNINDSSFWVRDFGVSLPVRVATGEIEFDPETGDPIDNTVTELVGNYAEVTEYINALIEEADSYEELPDGSLMIDGVKHQIIDEAMVLYTTYFRSTKRETNEQTGQLGLGSKSPFTITDSFQVRVFFRGEVRQYSLNINDHGIPEVNLIDALTVPTSEPDGVEVRLDVKYSDIYAFERSAKTVYRDFDVRPVVLDDYGNPTNLEYDEYDKFLEGDGWFMAHNLHNTYVRMGGVRYPVDVSTEGITEINRKLLSMKLMIDCPLGAFDIIPSREAPKYTKKTIAFLNARLDEIRENAEERIRTTLDQSENLWEARCWANDLLFERQSELSNLAKMCKIQDLTYDGEKLGNAEIGIRDIDGMTTLRFVREENYGRWYSHQGWKACRSDNVATVKASHDTVFVVDDLPRGAQSRVRHMIKQQPDSENDCDIKRVYVFKFETRAARDKLLKKTGFPADKLLKASELEKAPSQQRANKNFKWGSNEQVFVHRGHTHAARLIDYWKAENKDLNAGGIYVELSRYKVKKGDDIAEPKTIGRILSLMKNLGLPVPEVVGVRPSYAKHFRKHDSWIDFWSYVKTMVQNAVIDQDISAKIAKHRVATTQQPDYEESWKQLSEFKPKYQDSVMGKFITTWNNTWNFEKFSNETEWSELCFFLGVKLDVDEDLEVPNFDEEIKTVFKHYPLIEVLLDEIYGTWGCRNHDKVLDYIHMIDKSHNPNEVEDDIPF